MRNECIMWMNALSIGQTYTCARHNSERTMGNNIVLNDNLRMCEIIRNK